MHVDTIEKILIHATGLDYEKKPFRSHYCHLRSHRLCNEAVEKGWMAIRESELLGGGYVYFIVTEAGIARAIEAKKEMRKK